uniref:Uncharacterized protein n=1 Tax=Oryza sativa subsp. japonica TaxID=39947 RepID=Q6ZI63_ORYSJ|nr:hypothetical protein [Oryza sativa Japonica Group]
MLLIAKDERTTGEGRTIVVVLLRAQLLPTCNCHQHQMHQRVNELGTQGDTVNSYKEMNIIVGVKKRKMVLVSHL